MEGMKLWYDRKSKDPTYFVQLGIRNGKKTTTKNIARIGRHSELLGITDDPRVFNTCKWNNMAETAELRLFLCQVYKNLMLYGVVFHVKQWYNGGYETLV